MTEFLLKYFSISFLLILLGIGIKIYLKRTGIGDLRRILGTGVFWLKLAANAFLMVGIFCVIVLIIMIIT